MKLHSLICWLIFTVAVGEAKVSAQELSREILGIDLSMTKDAAQKRLQEIGTFVRHEEKQQEVWQVRDESFSHLIVGFGKHDKMRYVSAVARNDKDAKRVGYAELGDLKKARQTGDPKINNWRYEWELPAEKGEPHTLVIAAGRDPKYLTTYSLKNLESEPVTDKQ